MQVVELSGTTAAGHYCCHWCKCTYIPAKWKGCFISGIGVSQLTNYTTIKAEPLHCLSGYGSGISVTILANVFSLGWIPTGFFLHTFVSHFHGYVYCVSQLPESLDSNMIQCDSGSTMKNVYILCFTPRVVSSSSWHQWLANYTKCVKLGEHASQHTSFNCVQQPQN